MKKKNRATKATKYTNREEMVAMETVEAVETVDIVGEIFAGAAKIGLSHQSKTFVGEYE